MFNASGQTIDVGGLLCLFDAEGPCANAVHLPFEQALWLIIPINAKYLKLDARRTGIDDQDRVHRFRPPA